MSEKWKVEQRDAYPVVQSYQIWRARGAREEREKFKAWIEEEWRLHSDSRLVALVLDRLLARLEETK